MKNKFNLPVKITQIRVLLIRLISELNEIVRNLVYYLEATWMHSPSCESWMLLLTTASIRNSISSRVSFSPSRFFAISSGMEVAPVMIFGGWNRCELIVLQLKVENYFFFLSSHSERFSFQLSSDVSTKRTCLYTSASSPVRDQGEI